jgi:hypothetical protein
MTRKRLRKVDPAVVCLAVVITTDKVLFQTLSLGLRGGNGAFFLPDENKKCRLMVEQVVSNLVDQVTWPLDPDMSHQCWKTGISYSAVCGSECDNRKVRHSGIKDWVGWQVPDDLCD